MRHNADSRSTPGKNRRARPRTPWIAVALALCTLFATSLSQESVPRNLLIAPEHHVAGAQEALETSTPEPVAATLTPIRTPKATEQIRRPMATPTPKVSFVPPATANVEPSSTELSAKPPRSIATECDSQPMSNLELDLFDSINYERLQQGLAALRDHPCGRRVAEVRALDMAGRSYFSHQSPDGGTAISLLRDHGISFSAAGENLARNNYPVDQSVDVAITSLMESEVHRLAILGLSYTHLSVAFSEDAAGMKYYVMIFIGS